MLKVSRLLLLSFFPLLSAQAMSLPAGGYSTDFSAKPGAGDWSTRSLAGAAADILTESSLDSRIQTVAVNTVTSALADAANPTASGGTGQYSASNDWLLTKPTGVAATVLMATFTNDTGSALSGVTLSYDLIRDGSTGSEQVDGQRLYLNLSGNAGDWLPVGTFSTPGDVNVPLSFPVAQGSNFYLLWADENGSGSPDDTFAIDNFSLTPNPVGVPEPSAALLGTLCAAGLLGRRARR